VKVVHCVQGFPPPATGGIQSHLCDLAPYLRARDTTPVVAASTTDRDPSTYEIAGMPVFRYPTGSPAWGQGLEAPDRRGLRLFTEWVRAQDADVLDLHRWNGAAGLWHLREARRLGLATVVHVHLPEPLCWRGTLMYGGRTQCDGHVTIERCSTCLGLGDRAHDDRVLRLGTSLRRVAPVALALHRRAGSLPVAMRDPVRKATSVAWAPAAAEHRRAWLEEMGRLADVIVVPLQSIHDAFVANGVPPAALRQIPYAAPPPAVHVPRTPSSDGVLRVGFVGRIHPDKGVDVLVRAVRRLEPDVAVRLVIRTGAEQDAFAASVRALAAGDDRITFAPPFGRDEQDAAYAEFDVLAVPSQWFEMGPLVIYEGHAHALPILGSRLGGIAEHVRDEVDGLLVPHTDEVAWADALRRLATEPGLLDRLRAGIPAIRTLDDTADALVAAYDTALEAAGRRPVTVV
jgi:glycosyltransferase involved in cell wall biosynthesis